LRLLNEMPRHVSLVTSSQKATEDTGIVKKFSVTFVCSCSNEFLFTHDSTLVFPRIRFVHSLPEIPKNNMPKSFYSFAAVS
jgi:hypothetical protein